MGKPKPPSPSECFGVGINFTRFLLSPQRLQSVMEGFNEMQLNPQWRTKVGSTSKTKFIVENMSATTVNTLVCTDNRPTSRLGLIRETETCCRHFPNQIVFSSIGHHSPLFSCFPWLDILSRFRFSTTVRDFHTKTTTLQTLHLYLSPTYLRVEIHHQSIASLSSHWEIDLCHQGYF